MARIGARFRPWRVVRSEAVSHVVPGRPDLPRLVVKHHVLLPNGTVHVLAGFTKREAVLGAREMWQRDLEAAAHVRSTGGSASTALEVAAALADLLE